MTYYVTQWYLDETGHWTRYVAKRISGGQYSTQRDTHADNRAMSFADTNVGFGIPTVDTALDKIAIFNLTRGFLPDADTRTLVDRNASACGGLNIENATAIVNPTPTLGKARTPADGTGAAFLRGLLEYPRFVLPTGGVEVGGIDYLNLWRNNKPLPKPTITTPEEYLAEQRRKRGGFDETVYAFLETLEWIGNATDTRGAAQTAKDKINALASTFLESAELASVDRCANDAENALQSFCAALLAKKDISASDKKLDAIHDDLKGTKAAAERAAEAAERTAELMIRTLRPEWLTGEEQTPRSYIKTAGNIKMRIYDWWEEYKAQHDPEDNGGRQADYATFYYLNNGREIHTGVTLQELIEQQAEIDEKKRTPEEIIRRIIKSERQRQRVADKKQKTKPSQRRSKK